MNIPLSIMDILIINIEKKCEKFNCPHFFEGPPQNGCKNTVIKHFCIAKVLLNVFKSVTMIGNCINKIAFHIVHHTKKGKPASWANGLVLEIDKQNRSSFSTCHLKY